MFRGIGNIDEIQKKLQERVDYLSGKIETLTKSVDELTTAINNLSRNMKK